MYDKTKSVHDLAVIYQHYNDAVQSYHNLVLVGGKSWCEENEELKEACEEAEAAMRKYVDIIGSVYCDKENEIANKLYKDE